MKHVPELKRFLKLRMAPLVCLLALAVPAHHANADLTKQQVLQQTATSVILRNQARLTTACQKLLVTSEAFAGNASSDTLAPAQEACVETLLATRAALCYPAGPMTDLEYVNQFYFWPTRAQSYQGILQSSEPLTPDFIENLGAASKGLAVVEALLFSANSDNRAVLSSFAGDPGKRRGEFLVALARDLHRIAAEVEQAWRPDGGNFVAKFAEGGQESLNMLTNYIVYGTELITEGRILSAIALHSSNLLTAERIEGALSGTSRSGVLEILTTCRELYRAGIDDYLIQIGGRDLHQRIEEQFEACVRQLNALGQPLERAVQTARKRDVIQAYQKCKDLEVLLKVDLVSRLGVTLTFSLNDGD